MNAVFEFNSLRSSAVAMTTELRETRTICLSLFNAGLVVLQTPRPARLGRRIGSKLYVGWVNMAGKLHCFVNYSLSIH